VIIFARRDSLYGRLWPLTALYGTQTTYYQRVGTVSGTLAPKIWASQIYRRGV